MIKVINLGRNGLKDTHGQYIEPLTPFECDSGLYHRLAQRSRHVLAFTDFIDRISPKRGGWPELSIRQIARRLGIDVAEGASLLEVCNAIRAHYKEPEFKLPEEDVPGPTGLEAAVASQNFNALRRELKALGYSAPGSKRGCLELAEQILTEPDGGEEE